MLILKWITLASFALCIGVNSASAQFTASTIAQLRTFASFDNATITLAPGEYWLDGDSVGANFLDFSGSNTTFDLSDATIKIDTRDLAGYGNSTSVRPVTVTGNDNVILGLNLQGHDIDLATDPTARRFADRSGVYLQVTGNDNTLQDTTLLVRGSDPYGLGDVFGKGARPSTGAQPVEEGGTAWIHHRKMSAFLVTDGATNTIVDNLDLTSQSYGHGFFVQNGATNTTIRNSTITGELCQSNTAIAHLEYQEYAAGADGVLGTSDDGGTSRGTPLSPDIQLSCQEDGIRMYTGSTGLTVENVVVTNMRSGVHSTFASGIVTVDNVEVYGAENAFVPGSNTTITNSKGDITNGPLVYVQYNGKSNTTIDVELVGDVPVGVDWAVAYLNGSNFDVTVSSDLPAGFLPEDSLVRFGQTWFNNWRDTLKPTTPEEGDPGDFTNSTFVNNTNEYTVLGNAAVGNIGSSQAAVISNGKDNAYDGISLVPSATRLTLTHVNGLGNGGTAGDGSLETNASVVELGATLEIQPGISITDERLTISGNGIDGNGALYSDGTIDSSTRFGSSNSSDESTIFLDGNASIGVGIAGNQLIAGAIQGSGNLTKLGPGILAIGKASTYSGNLTVAEGHVVARPGVVHTALTVNAGASISGIGNNAFNTSSAVFLNGEMDINSRTDDNGLTAKVGELFGSGSIGSSNTVATSNSELTIDVVSSLGFFVGTIEDNIDLIKTGAGTQVLFGDNTYTGTTTVNEGRLQVDGTHSTGGDYFINSGGILGGLGTITSDVIIASGGVLAPGASAGMLTVNSADFQSGSSLEIELGGTIVGTDYDQLSAADLALGGTLELSLINSFMPASSDIFTIATAATLSGSFDNVVEGERVDTAGGEGSFLVTYNSSSNMVELSSFLASSALLEGDFNNDGIVDAADYSVWRDSLGLTGQTPYSGADADGDGQITQADYNLWVANYGATSLQSSSVAVPEPTSLLLLLGLSECLSTYRMRQ